MISAPIQRLEYQQDLPVSQQEAWAFLSRPENLESITPKNLGFEVTSVLPEKMYAGMIVTYQIRPMLGFAIPWMTEITQVREPDFFIDEQRSGPYRFWHHQHFLTKIDGGVRMIDRVHYQMPCGYLGYLLLNGMVRRRLEEIFSYRRKSLIELFGRLER